mgnify:CR=1 FL=1
MTDLISPSDMTTADMAALGFLLLGRIVDIIHHQRMHIAVARMENIGDAQRIIESIEALVRIHNAQEEDIYEHAASA